MLKENFLKFDSIEKLHRELTNIMLISSESSNYFYCYCKNDGNNVICIIWFAFLCSTTILIDGLPPAKFLKLYHSSREKLESCRDRIFPYFQKIERNCKFALDFFNKEYFNKEFFKNNLHLFDRNFLKRHPEHY